MRVFAINDLLSKGAITFIVPAFLLGCAKTKVDTNLPVLNTLKSSNSGIRLIALTGPQQVSAQVGGLTYNLTPNTHTFNYPPLRYTSYAPLPVALPEKVMDQAGNANIRLISSFNNGFTASSTSVNQVLRDDPANPTDYYIYPVSQQFGDPNYQIKAIPRSTTPPVGAGNIKIRLVNYGSAADAFNRTGPLTLTYSDGKPVSTVTTNVPQGVISDYTEIPYGAYRFRLFNQSGVEMAETLLPYPYTYGNDLDNPYGTRPTSIHSYQPGGIYTIFVNPNTIFFSGSTYIAGNSYTVIPDITAPANIAYGRVQFVNVMPGATYTLKLGSIPIGSGIGYRGITDYQVVTATGYSLQLTDQSGQTLATQSITIYPGDNYTVCAYPKNGQPALALVFNELTNPNQGQKIRFLNVSGNVPFITFMPFNQFGPIVLTYPGDGNDTISASNATQNLAQGIPVTHLPYAEFTPASPSSQPPWFANVYQSSVGPPPIVPGTRLVAVKSLQAGDFVANSSLYLPGDAILRVGEQGVYTAALTGSVDTAYHGTASMDTLLIVKHFK